MLSGTPRLRCQAGPPVGSGKRKPAESSTQRYPAGAGAPGVGVPVGSGSVGSAVSGWVVGVGSAPGESTTCRVAKKVAAAASTPTATATATSFIRLRRLAGPRAGAPG